MLLVDAGNSRCKWAWVERGVWRRQGVADNTDIAALRPIFESLPKPSRILVSNVAGAEVARRLREACAGWAWPMEFVTARTEQCDVRNGYQQPERLGSDRWAALIAAWHHVRGACLVVNCGTATTVDALSSQGEFIGGLILPGISLMQSCLEKATAQLQAAPGALQQFPRNTADAIYSGALCATVGAIQYQHVSLRERFGEVHCLLDGGAADAIQAHLELPVERMDNLVLRGLQIIGEAKA